jgi:hypothetical protein
MCFSSLFTAVSTNAIRKGTRGSSVPNIPSKSRGLADENKKFLTEWK